MKERSRIVEYNCKMLKFPWKLGFKECSRLRMLLEDTHFQIEYSLQRACLLIGDAQKKAWYCKSVSIVTRDKTRPTPINGPTATSTPYF